MNVKIEKDKQKYNKGSPYMGWSHWTVENKRTDKKENEFKFGGTLPL